MVGCISGIDRGSRNNAEVEGILDKIEMARVGDDIEHLAGVGSITSG